MPAAHKCAPASAFQMIQPGGRLPGKATRRGSGEKRAAQNVSGVPFARGDRIFDRLSVSRAAHSSDVVFEVSDISAARDTWEFVGLYNYVDLFSRQLFRVSFKNMMLIFLAGGAAVFLISLFLPGYCTRACSWATCGATLSICPRSSRPWP